jgi:hypothetical protein
LARFRFFASLPAGARATAADSSPASKIAAVIRLLPGPGPDVTVSPLRHVS